MIADLFALKTYRFSETGAVNRTIQPQADAKLNYVSCRFSSAPATAENFEIWADFKGITKVQTGRAPAGSKLWARCMCPGQNTGTLDFYLGIHEYVG